LNDNSWAKHHWNRCCIVGEWPDIMTKLRYFILNEIDEQCIPNSNKRQKTPAEQ
jgi:hypothetical protein